jgi:hypothetical protein
MFRRTLRPRQLLTDDDLRQMTGFLSNVDHAVERLSPKRQAAYEAAAVSVREAHRFAALNAHRL